MSINEMSNLKCTILVQALSQYTGTHKLVTIASVKP